MWQVIIPAIASAYGEYLSGKREREYNTKMANTVYQRSVADMIAAGLNPALMFGSARPADAPTGRFPNVIGEAFEKFVTARRVANESKVADAQAKAMEANAAKADNDVLIDTEKLELSKKVFNEEYRGATGEGGLKSIQTATRVKEVEARIQYYAKQGDALDAKIVQAAQGVKESVSREQLNVFRSRLAAIAVPHGEWTAKQYTALDEAITSVFGDGPMGAAVRILMMGGDAAIKLVK